MEKVITGNWDGKPIWRYKTAEERLMEELNKSKKGLCKCPLKDGVSCEHGYRLNTPTPRLLEALRTISA